MYYETFKPTSFEIRQKYILIIKAIAKATIQAIIVNAESESSGDSHSEEEAINEEKSLGQEDDDK